MRAIGTATVQQAELLVVLRVSGDRLDIQLQIQAPEVAAGNEVHHAGHGVGTVQRRGAILQRLNPVEGDHRRQRRGVDKVVAAVRGHGAVHLAAGVEQNQGGIHAQAAQVDIRRAGACVLGKRVGVVLGSRIDGQPLDDVADLVDAQVGDLLEADGGQRRGRIELRLPADVRTGDDDFLNGARGLHGLLRQAAQRIPAKAATDDESQVSLTPHIRTPRRQPQPVTRRSRYCRQEGEFLPRPRTPPPGFASPR